MRWTLFEVGHCLHPERMSLQGAPWKPCRFPFLAALIEHPRHGPVLFDTGYARRFFEQTQRFPGRLYRLVTPVRLEGQQALCDQLAAQGVRARDVAHIVVSHFHADHIGGLADFPRARIHCAAAAWEHARGLRGLRAVRQAVLPGLLPGDIEERLQFFEAAPRRPLPAGLAPLCHGADLFGDASLLAVPLPGHGVGHHGLSFTGADGRSVLLVGDAAWSMTAIRQNRPPPRLTCALMGDGAAYRQTLGHLHTLLGRNGDVVMVPCHCRDTATLRAWRAD